MVDCLCQAVCELGAESRCPLSSSATAVRQQPGEEPLGTLAIGWLQPSTQTVFTAGWRVTKAFSYSVCCHRLSTLNVLHISNPKEVARSPRAGGWPGPEEQRPRAVVPARGSQAFTGGCAPACLQRGHRLRGPPGVLSVSLLSPRKCRNTADTPHSRQRLGLCEAPSTCSRRGRSPGAPRRRAQPAWAACLPAPVRCPQCRARTDGSSPREKRMGEEEGPEGRGSG